MFSNYCEIEVDSVNRDLQWFEKVFVVDLECLFMVLEDFVFWDDIYDFIEIDNLDYICLNFFSMIFLVFGIEFVLIVDWFGNVFYVLVYGVELEFVNIIMVGLQYWLGVDGDLLEDYLEEYGLIMMCGKILMIVMVLIL